LIKSSASRSSDKSWLDKSPFAQTVLVVAMAEHEKNCRCLYSMGLARAIIDIPILLVFLQLAILCETSLPVFGFLSSGRIPLIITSRNNVRRCCSTLWNASKSNICGESGQIPTVMNPMSKRKIHLGGTE